MEYTKEGQCKKCNKITKEFLTKREMAFEELRETKFNCSSCNSNSFLSTTFGPIQWYDEILFDEWGKTEGLHFYSQDEHIILAELEYLNLLLSGIDNSDFLLSKRATLLECLCVLLYNYSYSSNEYSEEEQKERKEKTLIIRPDLIKRKDRIKKLGVEYGFIDDYIKEVVFPQLDL
jgi:hypothetical protein